MTHIKTIMDSPHLQTRRHFIQNTVLLTSSMAMTKLGNVFAQATNADRNVRIRNMEVHTVAVTNRTNWILVRLTGSNGITGIGEASLGRRAELGELNQFYRMVEGESAFAIQQYRRRGWQQASAGDRVLATAFSAIEQALWDLMARSLGVPFYNLLGGQLHSDLPVYANINRATTNRGPEGFAENAERAVADGFRAIKAAPFDGFPALDSPAEEIQAARELGIECVYAMRERVGDDIAIKIDAHSFFDTDLSIDVAAELEAANLSWYEEPVAPTQTENTKTIHDAISQVLAGGEFLFGTEGFRPLCEQQAVDIIMPDVKHCGGMWEAVKISALAESYDIKVSPHNPSGPVSTAASVALCAALPNFDILEYQWGEQLWRSSLTEPNEAFQNGSIAVSDRPGYGIALNERILEAHRI
ncbi:MAG: mandelate racemase/muconate lactonizing enzyme family protein [Gammaproteobacteria bacterium]|nr:mandelate racemase/muconate lactonizing enzyme family protein [Gammaproteobacteria bacterium]MDD9957544.1 mandelate racemase/muconate lactonizing enzyme family protein [Gammaproteobacteria bacterium]